MTEKQKEMNINLAVNFMKEIKMLASSAIEDISDSESMTDAWNKVDNFQNRKVGCRHVYRNI